MGNWKTKIRHKYYVANAARVLVKMQYFLGEKGMALVNLESIAANCTHNYIGTYRWVEFEKDIVRIARKEVQDDLSVKRMSTKLSVLHVLTEAYETGGHTQLVYNWIKHDIERFHALVITNQVQEVPVKLLALKDSIGIQVELLDRQSNLVERAQNLKTLSSKFDLIILHHHPYDIVPLLAYSGQFKLPVFILNHADHLFWVGGHIADALIQLRTVTITADISRRQIPVVRYLPIPITDRVVYSYSLAREKLGISNSQVLLLTIASDYKFNPIQGYNFFERILEILDSHPDAIMCMIGVDPETGNGRNYKHDRLLMLGVQGDTTLYENACDIYIESFPFASFTSLLQTVSQGKACQLMYNPSLLNKYFDHPEFRYPENVEEWKKSITRLIRDKEYRLSKASVQGQYVFDQHHVNRGWKRSIEELYKTIPAGHVHNTHVRTNWIYTPNEKQLFEMRSNNAGLKDIIYSKNAFMRTSINIISKILGFYRRMKLSY